MVKKLSLIAGLALVAGAAFFLLAQRPDSGVGADFFVRARAGRFVIGGRPFRFVGANVSVMYRDEDRARMPETLRQASLAGMRVVRVWASGEGGPGDIGPVGADSRDWPRTHPLRWAPGKWNEEALVHLDKVLAAAAQHKLLVQLCLANWWRDTGGVTQYLRWAGVTDAADENFRFGINPERAMLFYTNDETRRLYREHLEKIATRRNTVTGILYRDDPNIFGWELMNEAQAVTSRWAERRAWLAEMSSYLKSLDPNHIIAPGDWGYRTAAERREWLADHRLPAIDYCDVHNYPRDDTDSFVDSPKALGEFIDNRAAAALSLNKPLVFGEFGMGAEGANGFSQVEWYRAYLESNVRAGAGGAMFWILTPDAARGYGVTYSSDRDQGVLAEVRRASQMFALLSAADPPERLTETENHLVPRQFAWTRSAGDLGTLPLMIVRDDKSILYRFKPNMATSERFEKVGGGPGYIWGFGVGQLDYTVPARSDRRRVSELVVRAHIQPVLPIDAKPENIKTRVTLFVNGKDCGSRLIPVEAKGQPLIQEWHVNALLVRLRAMRGQPIMIRFAVTPESDWLYGVNISNWPEGYESHDAKPLEVEVRR
ncbi:MAG: mannan endo,4-beta-mannosidase [Pyrinomonadaceae bacterium]|jgi:mannan endo-1,4-beta-mannosidase|nr:mannan endo,4-beta-mannosidase [Pyrinomonadaceae bacterium]